MSGLNYNKRRVSKTKFIYMKDAEEGKLIHPNPLRYLKYEEKDMVSKAGKKFVAKSFIFEDVETGDRIGLQATGLFNYQMQEYRKGDVIEVEYNGQDEEDRHQTTIIECEIVGDEAVNAEEIKKVQDNTVAADEDGDEDDEDYV